MKPLDDGSGRLKCFKCHAVLGAAHAIVWTFGRARHYCLRCYEPLRP